MRQFSLMLLGINPRSVNRLRVEMAQNRFRLRAADDRSQRRCIRLFYCFEAAKVLQQSASGQRTDSGNLQQFSLAVANLSPFTMKRHSKPMRLIAHELYKM